MRSTNISIDAITKIEGSAGLEVVIEDDDEPVRRPAHAGAGMRFIEAPRGLLYHMARVDEEGVVEVYDVIVPTAQNQINIENDLRDYFSRNLHRGEDALRMNAESIIRAYDPCMSCATNFLKIDWIRE